MCIEELAGGSKGAPTGMSTGEGSDAVWMLADRGDNAATLCTAVDMLFGSGIQAACRRVNHATAPQCTLLLGICTCDLASSDENLTANVCPTSVSLLGCVLGVLMSGHT